MQEIDLYLISGFLGSGKTTFLKRFLKETQDKKVGVLVNEFGSVGIDGTLVEQDGMHLVEISNGSIFCSCLKGEFVKTLIAFSKLDIDILIVENSGLADPSSIHMLLEELKGKVVRNYNYKGGICIVDAVSFTKYVKVLTPIQNQIISSDFIVINKIDLVPESTLQEIRSIIAQYQKGAACYETMYSDVPWNLFYEQVKDSGYCGETSNHPWNRPSSYAIECDEVVIAEKVKCFLENLNIEILRAKGFMKTETGWMLLDATEKQCEVEEYTPKKHDLMKNTKLVIICNGFVDYQEQIKKVWEETVGTTIKIYL